MDSEEDSVIEDVGATPIPGPGFARLGDEPERQGPVEIDTEPLKNRAAPFGV